MNRLLVPLLAVLALPLAACSSTGSNDGASLDKPATTNAASATAAASATGTDTAALATATGDPTVGASTGGAASTGY